MRLTSKGRYAVTAAVDLVLNAGDGLVSPAGIAARQDLSQAYLERLLGQMRRSRLVQSVRGPGGGYRLARPAEEISVADVVRAVNESLDSTRCGGRRNCHGDRPCLTHNLWESLNVQVEQYLDRITLAEVAQGMPAPIRNFPMHTTTKGERNERNITDSQGR